MDPIEKAIRTAFEKGNVDDKAFREKVYRSAFAALDRALQANPNLTVETAINRRKNLQAKIDSIESEHLPAVAAEEELPPPVTVRPRDSGPAPSPFVEPVATVHTDTAKAPPIRIEPIPTPSHRVAAAPEPIVVQPPRRQEPSLAGDEPASMQGGALGGVTLDRGDARVRRRRRRPFATLFVLVTIVAACAIGGWWAYSVGLFKPPVGWNFSGSPSLTIEEEDFEPPAEGAAPALSEGGDTQRNWITVFSPDDPTSVSAPAGAAADVMQDESGSFLRIRSGSNGAAVIFDVGQGVLEQIVGKQAVFDIVARAEEGKETQISISCDFGELGDCGRRRYAVGYERGEYLFDIDLPQKAPGASGSIALNSDFENKGRAVDIYEIRVSVSQ